LQSACTARLISTFSGLKLYAVLNGQIDEQHCLEWGNKISKAHYFKDIQSIYPIHQRLLNEPAFIVGDIYYNSIKILVVNFTSTIEFFLKDTMRLYMMCNFSLFRKGLNDAKISIAPNDIIDYDDVNELRLKYIKNIANIMSTGELWSNKLRKYISFLNLPKDLGKNAVVNLKIDSIWKMRNDIAHQNIKKLFLYIDKDEFIYDSNMSHENYIQFILFFINLIDDTIKFLTELDKDSLERWPVTTPSLV